MRKNRFGVPVFYNTDALIKHVTQQQDMEWSYRDTELYEHAWQNRGGDDLWIEDITQILSPTQQTHLSDFEQERYRVLEQESYRPDASLQETFDDLDDALDYVEDNYDIDL